LGARCLAGVRCRANQMPAWIRQRRPALDGGFVAECITDQRERNVHQTDEGP
jgi:hypothetical protein